SRLRLLRDRLQLVAEARNGAERSEERLVLQGLAVAVSLRDRLRERHARRGEVSAPGAAERADDEERGLLLLRGDRLLGDGRRLGGAPVGQQREREPVRERRLTRALVEAGTERVRCFAEPAVADVEVSARDPRRSVLGIAMEGLFGELDRLVELPGTRGRRRRELQRVPVRRILVEDGARRPERAGNIASQHPLARVED